MMQTLLDGVCLCMRPLVGEQSIRSREACNVSRYALDSRASERPFGVRRRSGVSSPKRMQRSRAQILQPQLCTLFAETVKEPSKKEDAAAQVVA